MLVHKGFIGQIEFDMASGTIIGEVINAPDVILFQGESALAVKLAFQEAVDDYVAFRQGCSMISNVLPFSSPISVHLRPLEHHRIVSAARAADKSVNDWCSEALQSAVSSNS